MTMTIERMRRASPHDLEFDRLLDIVRGEYLEMPGLRLTRRQARRLWALDDATCEAMLTTLQDAGFLRLTRGGDYILAVPR
jgi:hypothetical protein